MSKQQKNKKPKIVKKLKKKKISGKRLEKLQWNFFKKSNFW